MYGRSGQMRKISFKFEDESNGTYIEYTTDSILVGRILTDFQNFLSACGYKFTLDEEILLWDHNLDLIGDSDE